jgi:fibronectin-binding autotransporter adhesin
MSIWNNWGIRFRNKTLVALLGLLSPTFAPAQLIWGTGGNGGSGTWNNTATNWWNGSANVPWTPGVAIFSGTGGTVNVSSPLPSATALRFDAPGYTLEGGLVRVSGPALTVTANLPATISSALSGLNTTLVKEGQAALTVAGSNFIRNIQINGGEYRTAEFSSLSFANVSFADAPGVTLTLGQRIDSTSLGSLSGGGPSGGIVQPDTQARTVRLTIGGSGTFRGIVQDNGLGRLGLNFFSGEAAQFTRGTEVFTWARPVNLGTEILTNTNTHSGATSVSIGTLEFSGSGSALNSPFTVSTFGVLRFDNSSVANANRLSDSLDLTINGGRLELLGNATTSIEEQTGSLRFAGGGTVSTVETGAPVLLTFAGIARQNRGTVSFTGNGRVKWNGITNDATGIVGTFATVGKEWATVGSDGRLDPLATYATDLNAAAPNSHVKLSGGGLVILTSSASRSTLNLQNQSGVARTLDLGSHDFTLSNGGLLSSGNSPGRIQNGTLSPAGAELIVDTRNDLTIAANLTQILPGTVLIKSGEGILVLTGDNSFNGLVTINQGILVASNNSLGAGSQIEFGGGTLRAAESFTLARNLTKSTESIGAIDTAGFDVILSGTNGSGIDKKGEGSLIITNPSKGINFVSGGTLALLGSTSGDAKVRSGTLIASGTLASVSMSADSTLDIGGSASGSLRLDSISFPETAFTIRYDLGSVLRDSWSIVNPVPPLFSTGNLLFDFHDLGGTIAGKEYILLNGPFGVPPSASTFGIAPEAASAGWSGTFTTTPFSVGITFNTVPEPNSLAVFTLVSLGAFRFRRTRRFQAPLACDARVR